MTPPIINAGLAAMMQAQTVTTVETSAYIGPDRRDAAGPFGRRLTEIPEVLLGCTLISEGQSASRYLQALEAGDLDRLRRMLASAIDVGQAWEARLTK